MRMSRNSLADLVCSEWAFVMSIGMICDGSAPPRFPLFLFVLASSFFGSIIFLFRILLLRSYSVHLDSPKPLCLRLL